MSIVKTIYRRRTYEDLFRKANSIAKALFNYLTKVSNIFYIENGYLSFKIFELSNFEDLNKKYTSFEDYIIKNFDTRYMHNDNMEDETNYLVDSITEKHNEEMRIMITETIDKVYAEYLEKHKDSIYIYYPKKEDFDWKPLADGEDWTY